MAIQRNASVAVIGAGDYIGAAIARKFAAEGFIVFAGRRNGEKLASLVAEIEALGGRAVGRRLDARVAEDVTAFLGEAESHSPLEVCIFNVGANVNFPLLETCPYFWEAFSRRRVISHPPLRFRAFATNLNISGSRWNASFASTVSITLGTRPIFRSIRWCSCAAPLQRARWV